MRNSCCRFAAPVAMILALTACGVPQKSDTQQANELVTRGMRVQNAGDSAAAAEDYRKALAHDAHNKFAYYNLGLIAQLAGNEAEAEKDYRAALKIDPDMSSALYNLAILRTKPDPSEALKLYQHAVQKEPRWAGAHLNLGFLLRSLGKEDLAQAEFKTAIALDPSVASRIPPAQSPSATPSPSPSS